MLQKTDELLGGEVCLGENGLEEFGVDCLAGMDGDRYDPAPMLLLPSVEVVVTASNSEYLETGAF